jgi:hypothetical protein
MEKELFYDIIFRENEFYFDKSSRSEVIRHFKDWFYNRMQSESLKNNEVVRDDYSVMCFTYDEYGNRELITMEDKEIEYIHYHGDYAEHEPVTI